MVPVELSAEKMKEWFPKTYASFIKDLRNSSSKSGGKSEDKISWMISWGVFGSKTKDEAHAIQKQIDYDNKLKLPYEERCAVDLEKLRIHVSMKAGYYIRTDRSLDKEIPEYITDMFYEVMKVTMLQEQLILKDPVVMESLEEFKYLLDEMMENLESLGLEIEGLEEFKQQKKTKEQPLNMDDILDKISETGMQSLNAKELKFLEKMSRG
jgi:hypothetical protein